MSSPFAVTVDKPPGQGWVRLPVGEPRRPALLDALRGKDRDLPEWSASAARELLGPQASPEQLDARAKTLAGLAANGRRLGMLFKYAWLPGPDAIPVAHIDVSILRTSRAIPELTLDILEGMYDGHRSDNVVLLDASRPELPAGPAVRLHRRRQDGDDPEDTVVTVTYLCRPPQIKAAVNFTMYWLISADDPALTEYADDQAATLRVTVEQ